jgi:hypothetical protein
VRDMKASILDTEFPTLYDAWTQQDDATVEEESEDTREQLRSV